MTAPSVSIPVLLRAFLIAAATLWVYGPALHGGWLWDDDLYITQNPLLHDPARLWKAWFQPGSFIEYYPLTETAQWLQWQAWHNDTLGYHLTNLALHVVSALLFWRLLGRFGLRFAWVGALIFALHPANVESIAWISELKTALAMPPFLLAMTAWIDFSRRHRRRDYFLALGFFLIALLCKISVAPFPLVILLHAWWKNGRIDRPVLAASAPFFALSFFLGALSLGAGVWFTRAGVNAPDTVVLGGLAPRLCLAGETFLFYLSKSFWPFDLLPVYPQWQITPPSTISFFCWLLLAAAVAYCWHRRKSWGRHALLGFGFFVCMLAPFLGLRFVSYMNFTWVMDHFLYVPLLGLTGLAVAALGPMEEKLPVVVRPVAAGTLALALGGLAAMSRSRAADFQSQETLWTAAVRGNPGSAVAHNNLGLAYLDRRELPEAIAQFRAALAILPGYAFAHNGLGNALYFSGQTDEAVQQYHAALATMSNYPEAHNGLASALLALGRLDEARVECERSIQANPRYADAYCNLGLIDAQQGNVADAIRQFEIAQKLRPNDARIAQELDSLRASQR